MRKMLVVAVTAVLLFAACGADDDSAENPDVVTKPDGSALGYPRSVEGGSGMVTIVAKPVRIAALSTDVAEVVFALVATDRIVAVPAFNTNPAVGNYAQRAAKVPHQFGLGDKVDASVMKKYGVDLVILSPNHPEERTLAQSLANSKIPVLLMPNSWDTIEDARSNILLIGEAVGAEAEATAIVDDMESRLQVVVDRLAGVSDRPEVLIFTNVAGPPFLIGPGTSTTDLVRKAGGVNAAQQLGMEKTISPVFPRQIVAADADFLLLIDGLGSGRAGFATLLDIPEVAATRAVTAGRVLVLPARDTFGVGQSLVNGLEDIAVWLHPEAFS